MRLIGWCTRCRRIKQVRVTVPRAGGVQMGLCSDCEAKR